jgi:CheY-like chemotaxis protein
VLHGSALIADDSAVVRKALCQMFEHEEGYDICAEASNGQEAIDLAVELRPDLVVLDLAMPVLDGMQAAKKLKQIMPGVPIILFTQYGNLTPDLFGPERFFDAVVAKSDVDGLIQHIKALAPVFERPSTPLKIIA